MEAILLPLLSNLCTTLCSSWFTADAEEPIDEPEKIETFLAMRSVYTPTLRVYVWRIHEGNGEARSIFEESLRFQLLTLVLVHYLPLPPVAYRYPFLAFSTVSCTGRTGEFAWVSPSPTIERKRERERHVCEHKLKRANLYSYFRPTIYRYLSSIESQIGDTLVLFFFTNSCLSTGYFIPSCLFWLQNMEWEDWVSFRNELLTTGWERERQRETDVCRHDGATSYEQGPAGS